MSFWNLSSCAFAVGKLSVSNSEERLVAVSINLFRAVSFHAGIRKGRYNQQLTLRDGLLEEFFKVC